MFNQHNYHGLYPDFTTQNNDTEMLILILHCDIFYGNIIFRYYNTILLYYNVMF